MIAARPNRGQATSRNFYFLMRSPCVQWCGGLGSTRGAALSDCCYISLRTQPEDILGMARRRANKSPSGETRPPNSISDHIAEPDSFFDRIENMNEKELKALVDRLARPSNREMMPDFLFLSLLAMRCYKLEAKYARVSQAVGQLKHARLARDATRDTLEFQCREAERRAKSKKKMSKTRVETAEAFQKLRMTHPKQLTALRALVKLPEEQRKQYALNYRKSNDDEGLRQYIKNLMRIYRNHQEFYREVEAIAQYRRFDCRPTKS
jgi:hypothetical protein